jgi:hypothetical protein
MTISRRASGVRNESSFLSKIQDPATNDDVWMTCCEMVAILLVPSPWGPSTTFLVGKTWVPDDDSCQ